MTASYFAARTALAASRSLEEAELLAAKIDAVLAISGYDENSDYDPFFAEDRAEYLGKALPELLVGNALDWDAISNR